MAFLNVQLLCIAIFVAMTTSIQSVGSKVVKGIYWPSDQSNFPPSAIDTSLFSHVYYAFVVPSDNTYQLDISISTGITLRDFTTTLHDKSPTIKALLSIGGGDFNSTIFSQMASNYTYRQSFIHSTIDAARRYGLDGLDLDWEFPKTPKEMDDLAQLLHEWREEIDADAEVNRRSSPLLLTGAVYFSVEFFLDAVGRSYPVASMNKNMDFINVMCYDYHGAWNKETGALAALFDQNSNINTRYGLNSWIHAGAERHKLIMGLPLYGRTWELKDPNVNGLGAPAAGEGPGKGVLSHVEDFNSTTVVYDVNTVTVYSYVGTSWMSYEDPLTVTAKIGFAQALRLGGYFFWAAGSDREWKISKQASKTWVLR